MRCGDSVAQGVERELRARKVVERGENGRYYGKDVTTVAEIWAGANTVLKKTAEAAATALGRAANRSHGLDGLFARHAHGHGILETVEHLIGGVLEAGVGLVELARRLGGKLAQLIAVVHVSEGSKNQI